MQFVSSFPRGHLANSRQTVGHRQAIKAILQATIDAMGQIDGDKDVKNIFKAVWIGIAGLNQQRDHDLFMPFVKEVFGSSTKIILSNGELSALLL